MEYSHLLSLVNPTTVSGILAVLFLFYVLRKPRDCRRSPPEAGRAWPIIGHLPFLGDTKPISVILSHMADKYGPIFTIRTGVRKTIIVSSWEIAKECFTTNDIVFANRSKCMAAELMGYNYAMFGWSSYGPYWRHLRKIVTLELLSNHRLKVLSHLRESEVESAIKGIHELWVKNNKSELKVEMKKWFGDITLKTTLRMVVGKRLVEGERSKESSGDHDEGNDDRCRKVIKEFFDVIGAFPVSDAVPWLRWCDFGGYERAMKKKAKELDQLVEEWLEEHKRKIDDERDLMRVMLSLFDDDDGTKEFSSYDADTIIKATCVAFILGGIETITTTLTWALALLLNNREVLKKAQQELDEKIGGERQWKEFEAGNLVYLQAILKETLRLYPGSPFPHESSKDCIVGGYHVPAGTRLVVNALKVHLDPKVWSDPYEFRPERFLTTHQNIDVRGQNFELIPFGSGRRMCPGVSYALQIMQLTLAALLHEFEIKTPSNQPVDMTGTPGIINVKLIPLDVLLTPRPPNQVYQN